MHTHICAECGASWSCGNPGCQPGDDLCKRCELDLADEYWQAHDAPAVEEFRCAEPAREEW